jgi:hypothetical protein
MKKLSMSLAATALLALTACGGGSDDAANNALAAETPAEDLTLPEDNLTTLPADETNGLGTTNGLEATDLNAADLNASANVTNSQ